MFTLVIAISQHYLKHVGLSTNQWPFASDDNSVEYPVITAMVMYLTSFAANSPVSYFNVNIFFLILLFIATVMLVRKIRPEFAYLVPVAPAMIASLIYQLGFVGYCQHDACDLLV
jgi:hypothetical protein